MPDTPLLPVVQKHRNDDGPIHWDVWFPCCEAESAVNFSAEADACAFAEAHKCVAKQDAPEEAVRNAAPVLDIAAIALRARLTVQKRTDMSESLVQVDVPNLVAAIERVLAVAVELAESGNTVMSAKRASDLIVQALNLKEN